MLLERIARHMQNGAGRPAGTFIRHEQLTGIISTFLTDHNISRPAADVAADTLIEHLRTRNFLLAHYGGGIYSFVHRAFLEHLAARDLLRRRAEEEWTREEFVELLIERAEAPAWHEVLLLTAGDLKQRDVAALLARLLHQHRMTTNRWETPILMLAIRVLAEVKDISPTPGTTDRRLSVAAHSNVVIDHLTSTLRRHPYLDVDEALPALGTFDRYWDGRERYLRWVYAAIAFSSSQWWFAHGRVVVALSRDLHDVQSLERIPWDTFLHRSALEVLGERWPNREDSRHTVLTATTDIHVAVRNDALHVLAAGFPDAAYRVVYERTHRDQRADLRVSVAKLLALLWPREPETLVLLTDLAVHDEETVRSTAGEALALVKDWSALAAR